MQAWRSFVPIATLVLLGLGAVPATAEGDPVGTWPLRPTPEVVHDFEPPAEPWGSGHRGIDLAGTVGQRVHSSLAGTIAFAGHIAGKPVVTVSHGETRTTYEPVSSDLDAGDPVSAGRTIGTLELPFSHCFPKACLHWGWLRGETYLDPLDLVSNGRVRLLPLWRDVPVGHGDFEAWRPPSRPAPSQPAPLPYASWSPLRDFLP